MIKGNAIRCLITISFLVSLMLIGNTKRFSEPLGARNSNATQSDDDITSQINIQSYDLKGDMPTIELKSSDGSGIDFQAKGATVLSSHNENGIVKASLSIDSCGAIVSAKCSEQNNNQKTNIYFAKDSNGEIFFSRVSLDDAKKSAGFDSKTLFSGLVIPIIDQPLVPVKRSKTMALSFSWEDSIKTKFPLVGAKVLIETKSGKKAEAFTKSDGAATFAFWDRKSLNNANYADEMWDEIAKGNYSLKLQLQNSLVKTVDSDNQLYEIEIDKSKITGDGYKEASFCFSPYYADGTESDFGESAQIFQSLYYYSKHAEEIFGQQNIGLCTVMYPSQNTERTFRYFNDGKRIEIGNGSANNKSIKPFESWDAIGHEYGHHVQNELGFLQTKLGYNHWASKDDSVTLFLGNGLQANETNEIVGNADLSRETGLKMAWNESWPTFWATVAQSVFPDYIKNETYLSVGDSYYYASNFGRDSKGNFEFQEYDKREEDGTVDYMYKIDGGDSCELAIIRFLYQLWDSDNKQEDVFTVSEVELWKTLKDTIRDYGAQYFYQYLSYLGQDYGTQSIYNLAKEYVLLPNYIRLNKEQKTITWTRNSWSPYLEETKTGYNVCTILIFKSVDDSNPLILNNGKALVKDQLGYRYNKKYSLTESELTKLLKMKKFYICLEISYRKDNGDVIGPMRTGLAEVSR